MRLLFIKFKLPPRITENEVLDLLPLVRQQNEAAKQRMTEGYIRLVAAITARYALSYPNRARELFSVGLLALTVAIDRVSKNIGCETHDNVSAYVHKYVKYEILEWIKIDHTVRPPLNSPWLLQKLKEHGREYLYREFGCIPYVEDIVNEYGTESCGESDGYPRRTVLPLIMIKKDQNRFDFTQVELLESDFLTQKEKTILKLRIDGHTNARIGRAIGYSEARVGQMIAGMEKRVRKIIRGYV